MTQDHLLILTPETQTPCLLTLLSHSENLSCPLLGEPRVTIGLPQQPKKGILRPAFTTASEDKTPDPKARVVGFLQGRGNLTLQSPRILDAYSCDQPASAETVQRQVVLSLHYITEASLGPAPAGGRQLGRQHPDLGGSDFSSGQDVL